MNTDKQMAAAAAAFAKRWRGEGYEKGQSQMFWTDLLTKVYGVEDLTSFVRFEEQVKSDASTTNFIDVRIPSTKVFIEQKSINKDLRAPIKQSDGNFLTPFQQVKRYANEVKYSERPRWIVTCNFKEFLVYDMEQPNSEPESILLKDLETDYHRLKFLVDEKSEHISKEMEVSIQAGEIVGRIYDALLKSLTPGPIPAGAPTRSLSPSGEGSGYTQEQILHALNQLCVQIVFCLYAEDAGVFARDQFHNYLARFEARDLRRALINLFEVLDTPYADRDPYLEEELAAFPYVNGGLFSSYSPLHSERGKGMRLVPQFTDELREALLQNASLDFDWSKISPTIFGAVFESTLNPETRRAGGMHYTSIENIHKVIDPLFLNALRREFESIIEEKVEKVRNRLLDAFQDKLASLVFFDPACGSGNFLTETYLSLRRLENEVIRARYHGQTMMGVFVNPIKVSIGQFYGIEINDFAVTVATTALWISEAQMLAETEKIIQQDINFLPLKTYSNITEGNALRIDWATVVPVYRLSYIIGNPPFVGARMMSESQKQDVIDIFGAKWKNVGNLDYVCCWYKKAAELMATAPKCRAALVSTNSICQGEQVANLWQKLFENGIRINFAHRTFRWDSEASQKAHVHCVIVGFSYQQTSPRLIFDGERRIEAGNINAYLADAPDVFVGSRQKPIADIPEIGIGNLPIDGGNYLFEKDEMEAFVKTEPESAKYFHPWYGSVEFLHQKPRYCLWLGDCSPAELRRMPHCMQRVENVRNLRQTSNRASTRKLADIPTRFSTENMPKGNFIIVPKVSSEKRRYVPMGFMSPDVMASDLVFLIPNATLYHFGILESNVHMAWMRAVCGRLEMRYRYSKDVVYNNFPWPSPTPEQKAKIEQTAQGILDARALYPDSSLADLYDEVAMPPELRRAHQQNDRAVMEAYGWKASSQFTESMCVAELFKLYKKLTK